MTSSIVVSKSPYHVTNLIQLSGSVSQLVLHSKRSQFRNPIGGVSATPLSSPATRGESSAATHNNKDEEAAIMEAFVPPEMYNKTGLEIKQNEY